MRWLALPLLVIACLTAEEDWTTIRAHVRRAGGCALTCCSAHQSQRGEVPCHVQRESFA